MDNQKRIKIRKKDSGFVYNCVPANVNGLKIVVLVKSYIIQVSYFKNEQKSRQAPRKQIMIEERQNTKKAKYSR